MSLGICWAQLTIMEPVVHQPEKQIAAPVVVAYIIRTVSTGKTGSLTTGTHSAKDVNKMSNGISVKTRIRRDSYETDDRTDHGLLAVIGV